MRPEASETGFLRIHINLKFDLNPTKSTPS